MSARQVVSSASSVPSASAPSFIVTTAAWRLSVSHSSARGSTSLTGRPALRASAAAIASVRRNVFAPNEPPIGGTDDPHAVRGEPEDARQLLAQVERRLCAREHLEPVAVPAGDARMRLHGRVLRRGRPVRLLDDHVRIGPGRGDVAVAKLEAVAHVRPRLRAHPEVRARRRRRG